jgi:hypothetical protein
MMPFLAEAIFLTFLWALYWLCRDRRRYLRRRVGKKAFHNVYQVGRNILYMLRRNSLNVRGDLNSLKKGCILYSFHFGVWELMPYTLSRLGFEVGIITNQYYADDPSLKARILDYLLRRWRSMNGVRVFHKGNVLEIARFLRSGGVFGMLVDGNTLFQKYAKASKLAQLCRVPLLPFAAYRNRERGVLHIGCDIPALVKTRPLDYVWFYRSR